MEGRGIKHSSASRQMFLLQGLLHANEVAEILQEIKTEAIEFSPEPDSVDGGPAYHATVIQHGEAKHPRLAALLAPLVERRLLPYVRQRYASEDVVVCDAFVRRYRASERLALSNHFDALSYVTAVVGLNPGEFSGGLYVQAGAGADSRESVHLGQGDVLFHQYHLQHGVSVDTGNRYSLVFWFCDCHESCTTSRAPWLYRAALAGNSDAQFSFGALYDNGSGGYEEDPKEAVAWYQRSAAQGNHLALNRLGSMYEIGRGVPENVQEALRCWRRAAAQGNPHAHVALGDMYREGLGVEDDPRIALKHYTVACDQGHPDAQHAMGEMYSNGLGVTQHLLKAEQLFRSAARQQHADAQYSLALLLLAKVEQRHAHGVGLAFDANRILEEAMIWLQRAGNQGHGSARNVMKKLNSM
eukprot:CAMPEP_0114225094 /NCGR_PEP_ID=MMETSP0058-20121206/469_1 /TAXON_ID=36894 /ORGANISM="Pyramimonas parkeae, CCMP726" /LENGTH=412 /DNA_ID=CAMNT_0001335637 /DNA_START=255 /DNA_END=1493 /DNA_ORIENTATION=+